MDPILGKMPATSAISNVENEINEMIIAINNKSPRIMTAFVSSSFCWQHLQGLEMSALKKSKSTQIIFNIKLIIHSCL
jgi:hypothetical protein